MDLEGRIVVVSPHLDDAALSLGAGVAHAARRGADVTVLTVFAGDPDSSAVAGSWDRKCGFTRESEAARVRREEDRRACALLGARPLWLPFPDNQYARQRDPASVWAALEPELSPADAIVVPGFPLTHPDHAWVTELVAARAGPAIRLGFYAEQPYAREPGVEAGPRPVDGPLRWVRVTAGFRELVAKGRAVRGYRSQFRVRSEHLPRRLLFPELVRIEERLAWR